MPDDIREHFLAAIPEFRALAALPDDPHWPVPSTFAMARAFYDRLGADARHVALDTAALIALVSWEAQYAWHGARIRDGIAAHGLTGELDYWLGLPEYAVCWFRRGRPFEHVRSMLDSPGTLRPMHWTYDLRRLQVGAADSTMDVSHLTLLAALCGQPWEGNPRPAIPEHEVVGYLGVSFEWLVRDAVGEDDAFYMQVSLAYEFWHRWVRARLAFTDAPTAALRFDWR